MVSVFGWPDPNTWDVAREKLRRFSAFPNSRTIPSVFGADHPNTETIYCQCHMLLDLQARLIICYI